MNNKLDISIIGAGVQGICLLRELQLDNHNCTVFDTQEKIGGLWTNRGNVPYLSLQINSRHYRFSDFSWKKSVNMPTAKQICSYLESYTKEYDLNKYIKLSTEVVNIKKKDNKCILQLNNNKTHISDLVICTGESSIPNIPKIYLNHKNTIHTSYLSKDILSNSRDKKCIVIGGSKSSADAVYHLKKNGSNVVWIARKFYTYAPFFPEKTLSYNYVLSKIPKIISSFSLDSLFSLRINKHDDINPGSGNFLIKKQHEFLSKSHTLKNNVMKVDHNSITLDNGKRIKCDMIVLGTGYHRSNCAITLGNKCTLNDNNVITTLPGYDNSGLLTPFGINNFHLLACGIKEWVKTDRSMKFETWWKTEIKPSKNIPLIMHQLHYLLTESNINRHNIKKTLLTTDNLLIIIILVILIYIFIRKKNN